MYTPTPINLTGSKFRNDRGALLTRSLFFETSNKPELAVYTLKDHDHEWKGKNYPSLFKLFIEANDPIEYLFATTHLDSWNHWETLCEATWFKPYVERWRRELELKIKATALSKIQAEARTGGRDSLRAHTYLLEKKWSPEPSKGRGRPSKEDIKRAADEMAETINSVDEDWKRIGGLNA